MPNAQHYALQRSLDTFLKTEGRTYVSPTEALKKKIHLGRSKSGPCKACLQNRRTGAKMPPLHPNCKCKEE